jgi:hypothetical protein
MPSLLNGWTFQQTTTTKTREFAGCENVFLWENGKGQHATFVRSLGGRLGGSWKRGEEAWGKMGITVSQMSGLPVALYTGTLFDNNTAVILPKDERYLPAIWAFCMSHEFPDAVRRVDQKMNVTNATLVKVPFDFEKWHAIAGDLYPNGLPNLYSCELTQWLFKGHVSESNDPLQVVAALMLGYRWPEQPKQDDAIDALSDKNGIVCIPAVRGEQPAAERLLDILHTAYGSQWSDAILHKLLSDAGCRSGTSLEDWLRDRFFEQHCKLFAHRPFIWHIWDGRRHDGFHALVNYHKLAEPHGEGRRLLENLTYSYLGDWIARQRDGVKHGEGGADDRLAAALELEKRLKAILDGEPPFDIFVRWKPLHQQPIGWEPDINDGVRVNIRPFMAADLPNGRTGAGVLRWKPNINWGKDKGKEPVRPQEQYPWFWKNGTFTGDRINDVPLTNVQKRTARQKEDE